MAGINGPAGPSQVESGDGGSGSLWLDGNWYAGGGGGGEINAPINPQAKAKGGIGGGGDGGIFICDALNPSYCPTQGTDGTGGGGGGGTTYEESETGRRGGSGVVVIRYLGTPKATGGTITQSGGYTYHRFLSSSVLST